MPPFPAEVPMEYCESIYAQQCPISGVFSEKTSKNTPVSINLILDPTRQIINWFNQDLLQ
jgi:hypothetical protein